MAVRADGFYVPMGELWLFFSQFDIYGALHAGRFEYGTVHPFAKIHPGDFLYDRQNELICGILVLVGRARFEIKVLQACEISGRFRCEAVEFEIPDSGETGFMVLHIFIPFFT